MTKINADPSQQDARSVETTSKPKARTREREREREERESDTLKGEIWRKRRALKREKHLDKIKESTEMGRVPKKTQSKHFNWKSIAKDENPESVLTKFFQDLYSLSEEQEELTQSERRHWVELWKNMRWNVGLAKETGTCLEETEKRERLTGSNHSRCVESIASRMFGTTGEVAVVDVLEHGFSGRLAVFVDGDGSESGGSNVLDQVQAQMRKVFGYVWLKSLPPLSYESVQTAFVPKTHADAGLFLLLKAAELSREWQREIVVVQLDVKKAFDHVDHRAAFKAMKLQGVSLFSMALIAAIWSGSCMKACLGTVTSNKVQMSRGLPQGAAESPVIFTMIMEFVLRDLIKSWISRKLAWRLDDLTLAAICYADDVVLIAVSVSAAETMVSEVIGKLKEVGLMVGAQKTHWTSFPKMMDKHITVDGSAVMWSLWDRWCVWTGMHDMRSHTEQLKPTNAVQNGNLC